MLCRVRRHKLLAAIVTLLLTTGLLFTFVYIKSDAIAAGDAIIGHSSKRSLNQRHAQLSNLAYRFPRLMIVGFGKAGTRALYEALKLHPRLVGPKTEQRFFSRNYHKGLSSYLNSLPDPPIDGYIIEKSPDYIIDEKAPSRLLLALSYLQIDPSSLKFIVMLRDPIYRAVSEYMQWSVERKSAKGPDLPPLPEMILSKDGVIDTSVPFINASCYAHHINHWLKYFPKEQLCFVDGDKFVVDPYSEIHHLEKCLKLEEFFTEQNFVYSSSKGFYCFSKSTSDLALPLCLGKSKGRKHPKLPQETLEQLQDFYKPWNDKLSRLCDRQFIF